jgi:hypothetical protein
MDSETKSLIETASKAADAIGEFADNVVILVSSRDADGNTSYSATVRGNVHAHEGLVREFLRRREAYETGYHMEQGRLDARGDGDE